ncbi:hypothetical protein, partial [uncultured Prevotella sp.]|uniref:hypothetical protein n=1 Tax=uncultured Prevotella sp. TaxID=159272 RepID=UPI00259890A4
TTLFLTYGVTNRKNPLTLYLPIQTPDRVYTSFSVSPQEVVSVMEDVEEEKNILLKSATAISCVSAAPLSSSSLPPEKVIDRLSAETETTLPSVFSNDKLL